MAVQPPGSFTKNFGWNQHPPGLKGLHDGIRAGFAGTAQSVSRDTFRTQCGLGVAARLISLNFFLHNTILNNANHVTLDELVRHAIGNPHSRKFDYLALFALHLARAGRRLGGLAGTPNGAAFTNDFVRNHLWKNGGWETSHVTDSQVEAAFTATIQAEGDDTVHKCTTNYLYIWEIMGLRYRQTPFINTHIDEWVGPGLFIAFDRYSVDRNATTALTQAELLSMVQNDSLHELMGTTQQFLVSVTPIFADEYLALGGMDRVTSPAPLVSSPTPTAAPSSLGSPVTWSDDDAENMASVLRRLQETQAQIRNAQHVRELKTLYVSVS
jgi:hypothetical protein